MDLSIPHALRNYIGGRFCPPQNGVYLQNHNPATGEFLCQVPDSSEADLADAISSANKAFPAWSATSPEERFNLLNLISFLITEYCEQLAMAETKDSGKMLAASRKIEIPRSAANFRFFATAAMQSSSESHSRGHHELNYTLRSPVGTVGCISPSNLPLYLFTWKIAPALATGNCVIAKPSEITPVTAYLLGCICHEAGLPAGVLNILHGRGDGIGEMIVKHPGIKAVSFTGSTESGRKVAALAALSFKKVLLEMGSHNPTIIFADCNWQKMLETVLQSSFANQGQICLCGRRILVERSVYERFKAEFIEQTAKIQVGNPLVASNKMGAILSQAHFNKVMNSIANAVTEGGTILYGGKSIQPEAPCEAGFFIEPTIIEGLGPVTQTNQQEIFGPVVTLQPFDTEEEAIQLANSTEYGLASSIWTENLSRANRMASHIQFGVVWINCWMQRDMRTPFGGLKNSGLGQEGGWEIMRFFTVPKNVCLHF